MDASHSAVLLSMSGEDGLGPHLSRERRTDNREVLVRVGVVELRSEGCGPNRGIRSDDS